MMIVPLLVDRMVEYITDYAKLQVPADDPSKAIVVKSGRFQDDPVSTVVHVAVSGGDPDDIKYRDGIITLEDMDRIGMRFPVREIGGGELWWRRGIITLGCYYIAVDLDDDDPQSDARNYAYETLGRIERLIPQIPMNDLSDEFGERAMLLRTFGNTFFETGGPPDAYVWRGKIYWSALTSRPF